MSGPLAGIKALDLSQVYAGPYCPGLLAHAGAEVIKVEALGGEIGRNLGAAFLGINWGKRAISLNLQAPEGQAVMRRLAAWADVLVENFRPGVMERLGIGYETLSGINPRIIHVSVTAFGETGPYSHRPGFDPLIQAMTGIERVQGGRQNPPVFLRIAITDFATAMVDAAAVAMALYERERTGRGQRIDMSLLQAGIFINGDAFTRYPGRPARLLPDAGQHGFGPLDRMYETGDGWLFILVEEDEERWDRLASLPGLEDRLPDPRFASVEGRRGHAEELAAVLEEAFRRDTTEAWLQALEARGVPCAPVIQGYGTKLFEDIQPLINGYTVSGEHSERGHLEQPGNYIRYSLAPTSPEGRAAPLLGEHTEEILREFGYGDGEIAALRSDGVIA